MYKVKLMNEYLHGPIWIYNADGIAVLKYPLISDDPILKKLNAEAMEIFSSYYEFDSHNSPCWFNHEKEKAEKGSMLSLIQKILIRLNEINDGTFEIEDLETSRLNNL
ncbi:RNA helicase [Dialister sp.]|uniref:RNA helicase n=1 Tax=Dialister sp. TaxID=1955814 RepID=UPI002E7FD234|nr:RNA helicase [Dialister sp.]MEE3453452.1 RNA helicase [Dialister sp.]